MVPSPTFDAQASTPAPWRWPRRWAALALSLTILPVVAGHAAPDRSPSTPPPHPWGKYLAVIAHPAGHYVLLDLTLGRRILVPDGTNPAPPSAARHEATQAPQPSSTASVGTETGPEEDPNPAEPAMMPPHTTERGWDTWLSGQRRSIYYPAVRPFTSPRPGQITTVVGGLCDGLPGPDVSVDPGDVVTDRAGRIFWLDLGWTAHLNGSTYVRVLDTDGIVHTLGAVDGPAEGRLGRDLTIADGLVRLVPDQQGGVYYSWSQGNVFAAPQTQGSQWDAGDDLPQWTAIGHLRADGTHEHLSGIRGRIVWVTNEPEKRNDRGPYADASFADIEAMVADAEGNLYVAEGDGSSVSGSAYVWRREGETASGSYTASGQNPPQQQQRLVRFLNRSNHDVIFYRGTPWEITVHAGQVDTIAGPPVGTTKNPAATQAGENYYAGLVSPKPGKPVPAPKADIGFVSGMVIDGGGNLRLLEHDSNDDTVKIVAINLGSSSTTMYGAKAPPGRVSQVGGSGVGYAGDGGPLGEASFNVANQSGWFWGGAAMDPDGALYISDTWNNRIRRVSPSGSVSTVAGTGNAVFNGDGRPGTQTAVAHPMGIAILPNGRPVFADWQNSELRTIDGRGTVRNLAGTASLGNCNRGRPLKLSGMRAGWSVPFGAPRNAAFTGGADLGTPRHAIEDGKGNVYVADPDLGVVRRIAPDGTTVVVAGAVRSCQSAPPNASGIPINCDPPESDTGDGGSPLKAILQQPGYLLVDRYDNLYISSPDAIRYINFGSAPMRVHDVLVSPKTIQTLLRLTPDVITNDLIPPFLRPEGVCPFGSLCDFQITQYVGLGQMALDDEGSLYVSNLKQNQVLALDWCGELAVVAGNGLPSQPQQSNGDGGPAQAAAVSPHGLAWDRARDLLLVADASAYSNLTGFALGSKSVRAINLGTHAVEVWGRNVPPGFIDTYAGGGRCQEIEDTCTYGDRGFAREAAFGLPWDVQVSPDGRVFVVEVTNRIRVIGRDGVVATVAGVTPDSTGSSGEGFGFSYIGGECGDGGVAYAACLGGSAGITLTPRGDLLVADFETGRLRRIHDVLHAPLRPEAPVLKGAGYRFTPGLRLSDTSGNELLDPTISFDAKGRALVMASAFLPSPNGIIGITPVGCDLWSYQPNVDGEGHDSAFFAGTPDGPYQLPGIDTKGGCSLSVAPPGGSFPFPRGDDPRVSYVSGLRGFPFWQPAVLPNVTSGASRDWGSSFLSSPAGLAASFTQLSNAFVTAADGDTTYMDFAADTTPGTDAGVSAIGLARSTGGTEYTMLDPAFAVAWPINSFPLEKTFVNRPVIGPDGTVYVPFYYNQCINPLPADCALTDRADRDEQFKVAVLQPAGTRWSVSPAIFSYPCTRHGSNAPDPWCEGFHGLPQLAIDRGGTLYAVWDDSHHVFIATSTDGLTWSPPRRIDRGLTLAGYPTIVAGDAGRVAVAFYGTRIPGRNLSSPWLQWAVYLTESLDADGASPRWTQTGVTDYSVHSAALCQPECPWTVPMAGFGVAGTYFSLAMNPVDGRAVIAYGESRGADGHGMLPDIVVTRQCEGPSLLSGKGRPLACAGELLEAATSAPPKARAVCPPQVREADDDAEWQGAERDNLDITSYGIMRAGDDVAMDISVKGFSAIPPIPVSGSPPATGMMWTGFWRSGRYRYWAQAATPAASSAGNKPALMQYRWGIVTPSGALSPVGEANGSVDGNTIHITVSARGVGDPKAGTLLWNLHARSDVLTAATPETTAASPVARQELVDSITTSVAYDPALRCNPPAAQQPASGGPLAPLSILPSDLPSPVLPASLPRAAGGNPAVGVHLQKRAPAEPLTTAPTLALGNHANPASWPWFLIRDDATRSSSGMPTTLPDDGSDSARPADPSVTRTAVGPLPTCGRRPPPVPPAPKPPPPPLVLPAAVAPALPPPPPPPVIEAAPGPVNAPVEAPAPANALQQSYQQSQQMTFQAALAPERQEEPQVAMQKAIDEARGQAAGDYSMTATDRTEERLWQLLAGGITVAAGLAMALARACVAVAGQAPRRRDRTGRPMR